MSKSLYDNGKAFDNFLMSGDGKLLQYTDEMLEVLIRDIEDKAPDFLVITGDLTCNGERESHLEMVKRLETIEEMGTCVFVLPGNHDIENPWASKYIGNEKMSTDSITVEDYLSLYAPFGYEGAVSKDPDSLSYLAMPTEDTWLLMLDSADYKRNIARQYPEQGGALLPQTLKWVEQCAGLAKENDARLVAVMHHSLIDHSELLNVDYTITNSMDALKVFYKCGIEIILTGHIHLQDIKTNMKDGRTVYDIATGSLSVYPHKYGRMDFTPEKAFDYSTVLLDMDGWARDRKSADDVLLNFKEYSTAVFIEQCCKRHSSCLITLEELPPGDREKVVTVMSDMNLMYFAGYRNEALDAIVCSEGYKLLENMPRCYTTEYYKSMLMDEYADNNIISIPILY